MGQHPLRTRFPRITPCANWTPSRSLGVFWRSSQPWHIAGSRNLYHVFSMAHMSASRAAGPLFGARARTDVRAREAMIYARSCCILDWTRCYTGFTSALLHSFSASCPAQVAIDRWCTCLTLDLLAGWQRRRADDARTAHSCEIGKLPRLRLASRVALARVAAWPMAWRSHALRTEDYVVSVSRLCCGSQRSNRARVTPAVRCDGFLDRIISACRAVAGARESRVRVL